MYVCNGDTVFKLLQTYLPPSKLPCLLPPTPTTLNIERYEELMKDWTY